MRTVVSVASAGLVLGILSAAPPAGAQAGAAAPAGQGMSAAPAAGSSPAARPQLAAGDLSSTRYLAANCANCHGTDGYSAGVVASLAAYPADRFIEQMNAFRDGSRPATIMHQLAKGYSETQIAALAAYFAAQPPGGSATSTGATTSTAPAAPSNASKAGTAQTPSGGAR